MPRVSVVTPTYRSASFLRPAVESVLSQTLADWQLVLFDDGSTDRTPELAEELARQDPRIRAVRGSHAGVAAARNGGLSESDPRSEFVTCLDSDDVWHPTALAKLVDALDANPSAPAAYGLARCIDAAGRAWPGDDLAERMRHRRTIAGEALAELALSAPTTFESLLVENHPVTPGTTLVRRAVHEAVGGFEPSLAPADDWDMNLRIARSGGFVLVNHVILDWRRHSESLSSTSKAWRRAFLDVRRRAISSRANTLTQRKAAEFAVLHECRVELAGLRQALARGQVPSAARRLFRAVLWHATYWRALHSAPTP